jgi:hypothetical protein
VDPAATEPNVKVRNAEIPIAVTPSVVVDLTAVAAPNAEVPSAVIPSAVTQNATGDFPNEAVLVAAPFVVRAVARGAVIQSAVIRSAAAQCVQVVAFQCEADLDAMVVLQNEAAKVLPHGARAVVPAGRLAPDAVHVVQSVVDFEVARVSQVLLPAPSAKASLRVVQCAVQA